MVEQGALPGNHAEDSGGSFMQRMLDGIERVGNKVPHPVMMFLYLIVIVVLLVVASAFPPGTATADQLDRFLHLALDHAVANKSGLPRGLQTGVAALVVIQFVPVERPSNFNSVKSFDACNRVSKR